MQNYNIKINCFNTLLHLEVKGSKIDIDVIKGLASILHNTFNIYDKNSEISRLNDTKELEVSPYLKDILEKCMKYEKLTDYYFNTDQTFQKDNNIIIRGNKVTVKNPLDLGGIAKGYYMSLIQNYFLKNNVSFKINFGGALLSSEYGKIKIKGFDSKPITEVEVDKNMCIHTSSFYNQLDKGYSHIYQYDLKKPYKVEEKKSISVISNNPILCDVFSTALYSMKFEEALAYIKKYNLSVVYILDNNMYITKDIKVSKIPEINTYVI